MRVYLTIVLRNRAEFRLILTAELAKIRGYSGRLSRIIFLLFNTLITKHSFIAEKLERIFILPFFSPIHEITDIAGYLLCMDDDY